MEHSIGYYITQMLSYIDQSDRYSIRNGYNFSYIWNADSFPIYMPFELKFYRDYSSILKNTFQSDCVFISFYRDSSMLVFILENSITLYFYYDKKSFEIVNPDRPVRSIVIDGIGFYEEVYEAFYKKYS